MAMEWATIAAGSGIAKHQEALKKKLSQLLNDVLRVGCVKGFKHFTMYMRGREELVVTVRNEPRGQTPCSSPANSMDTIQMDLPRNQRSLMISGRTQRRLSGFGYMNVGLPPASPSERELLLPDDTSTVFLIAGYSKYSCPYVWVRSNHSRLVRFASNAEDTAKDSPLKLKTTSDWAGDDVHLWDIIAELVDICTIPRPINPFSVDHSYFDGLTENQNIIATGAMIHFLQRVLDASANRYDDKVLSDIDRLNSRHFQDVVSSQSTGLN